MNEQTLQKMKQMKLLGMARAFSTSLETGSLNDFTTDEMISQLTIAEWDDRNNRRIERQVDIPEHTDPLKRKTSQC